MGRFWTYFHPEKTILRIQLINEIATAALTFQFQLFPTKTYKKGGTGQRLRTKSQEEALKNVPFQRHTTDVDDNTLDNYGKQYREIVPIPYIYSQILFNCFISKSMCLLQRQFYNFFNLAFLSTGSVPHLFLASTCEAISSHVPHFSLHMPASYRGHSPLQVIFCRL